MLVRALVFGCAMAVGVAGDEPAPAVTTPSEREERASAAPATPAAVRTPAVPFPNPLITEVLYSVPTGLSGDANKDGTRQVGGDEFVELVNPHDRPIELFGYTLTDSQDAGKSQVRFVFPALELAPGAKVVVFNGFECAWPDGVGDAKGALPGGNPKFGDSAVLSMKCVSSKVAFGNGGDHVLLSAPDGTPVQRVRWSEGEQAAPEASASFLDESVPLASRCSVQRDGVLKGDGWRGHLDVDRRAFSPGEFEVRREPEKREVEKKEEAKGP